MSDPYTPDGRFKQTPTQQERRQGNGRREQDNGATPCPVCGEQAVGCATLRQGDLVIRKVLGCVNCKTLFEPVANSALA